MGWETLPPWWTAGTPPCHVFVRSRRAIPPPAGGTLFARSKRARRTESGCQERMGHFVRSLPACDGECGPPARDHGKGKELCSLATDVKAVGCWRGPDHFARSLGAIPSHRQVGHFARSLDMGWTNGTDRGDEVGAELAVLGVLRSCEVSVGRVSEAKRGRELCGRGRWGCTLNRDHLLLGTPPPAWIGHEHGRWSGTGERLSYPRPIPS